MEYNTCPVGSYAGPYDQNESLNLSLQLPNSNLNYEEYSEYIHPPNVVCREFSISKNYADLDDLKKIDAINSGELNSKVDSECDEEILYTCIHKKCKIPCPCSICVTEEDQCSEHNMRHSKLFDEKKDSMLIRSDASFCRDASFLSSSYLVKYSGIPVNCLKCRKDLVHHKAYHIAFHENCKFCIQNWFKLRAESVSEFKENQKKEDHYYDSVCPYCNKKCCELYFAKKHVEYEHDRLGFIVQKMSNLSKP